jgi:hypothetical protein
MPTHADPPRSLRVLVSLAGLTGSLAALAACQPVRVTVRPPATPPPPAVTPATVAAVAPAIGGVANAAVAVRAASAPCPAPDPAVLPIPSPGGALVPVCRDVHVDPATTPAERAAVRVMSGQATRHVVRLLGPARSTPPVVILCKTDACTVHFAGPWRRSWVLAPHGKVPGGRYQAGDRTTIVIVRVDPGALGHLAHELVHVELYHRLEGHRAPAWFHEGAAAALANAPACQPGMVRGIDDLRNLDENQAWANHTNLPGKMHPTYCQARAEVEGWMGRNGRERFLALIAAVRMGAAFDDVYGELLTQPSRRRPHPLQLGQVQVTLSGQPASHVTMSGLKELADPMRPFSLAFWVKPEAASGVLAHVSSSSNGTGWCTPFIGFDARRRLTSQVLHGNGPAPGEYAVAQQRAALPTGRWAHVAMTWAPGAGSRLFVNGTQVAETAAAPYRASRSAPMFVTFGSSNTGGHDCWHGAIRPGAFRGQMADLRVYAEALPPSEVALLAASRP